MLTAAKPVAVLATVAAPAAQTALTIAVHRAAAVIVKPTAILAKPGSRNATKVPVNN